MFSKKIASALILSALLSTAAHAQSPAAAPPPPADVAKMVYKGEWRASKVIGLKVYNQQKDKIGDINEILVGPTGELVGFVVGVGGFLGMGEHDVLMRPNEVKFVTDGDAPYAPGTRPVANTGAATTARNGEIKWYPDHAIVSATKEQLKALPQFKYSNYN